MIGVHVEGYQLSPSLAGPIQALRTALMRAAPGDEPIIVYVHDGDHTIRCPLAETVERRDGLDAIARVWPFAIVDPYAYLDA